MRRSSQGPGRWIVAGILIAAVGTAGWLYRENRALRGQLAALSGGPDKAATPAASPWAEKPAPREAARRGTGGFLRGLGRAAGPRPELPSPEERKESRQERRVRRQQEIAAMLGRLDGESDADYKARVAPFVGAVLEMPRTNLAAARRDAEQAAGVTDDQHAQLDAAFADVYDELIAYTNSAVAAGDLTPYERNVSGLLGYAGGLGAILNGAEGRIRGILSPAQLDAIYGSGFEWAEYLGIQAPWERLNPPPAPPGE
jgi:hypothetical protein